MFLLYNSEGETEAKIVGEASLSKDAYDERQSEPCSPCGLIEAERTY